MKLIEFYKNSEVLVECQACKNTFKSPFKLVKLDDFYNVEIDYKYCPYCNKPLNCNKGLKNNEEKL